MFLIKADNIYEQMMKGPFPLVKVIRVLLFLLAILILLWSPFIFNPQSVEAYAIYVTILVSVLIAWATLLPFKETQRLLILEALQRDKKVFLENLFPIRKPGEATSEASLKEEKDVIDNYRNLLYKLSLNEPKKIIVKSHLRSGALSQSVYFKEKLSWLSTLVFNPEERDFLINQQCMFITGQVCKHKARQQCYVLKSVDNTTNLTLSETIDLDLIALKYPLQGKKRYKISHGAPVFVKKRVVDE